MRPLYAARLEDLGAAHRISVECESCKRVGLIATAGLGLLGHTPVLDPRFSLRCQGCGVKGRALVVIVWADQGA